MKYIPWRSDQAVGRCCCGREFLEHQENVQISANDMNFLSVKKNERWSVAKHTRCEATDAFGIIEFEGMAHPTKAQVRLDILLISQEVHFALVSSSFS